MYNYKLFTPNSCLELLKKDMKRHKRKEMIMKIFKRKSRVVIINNYYYRGRF